MNHLQNYRLPREIATLLQVRGTALPPLQFHDGASRGAKATLDRTTDPVSLLGKHKAADVPMVTALRALLYLWNGWPTDALVAAEQAPEAERNYLVALTARQRGEDAVAKDAFQLLGRHVVFEGLTAYSREMIGKTADANLLRFRQLLEMGDEWEPYAFVDLFEQCRRGPLSDEAQRAVRAIQCREFELLFAHCLEAALGGPLVTVTSEKEEEAAARERLRERKRDQQQQRSKDRRREGPASASPAPAAPSVTVPPPALLKIRCPKCNRTIEVAVALRGQATRCTGCAAQFLVPRTGAPAVTCAEPQIGVRCPKCQQTVLVAASDRGKPHACDKCHAQFRVPG